MNEQPAPLRTLARQLLAPPPALDAPHFCASCRDALPIFITDELAGEPVDSLYPETAYHLDLCPDCLQEYLTLSALTLAALFDEDTP